MFMIHDKLKLALVTEHVPVKSISDILNEGLLDQKIEQVINCKPEESWKYHEELINNAKEFFDSLGLHCRIMNICTGDIGSVAAEKYDIEVWMPAQETYREVVSCSNCTDYQARKIDIKVIRKDGTREVLHTLNNTAIANSRALVAILENYQQKDGSIKVPTVLQKYLDFKKIEWKS